MPTTNIFEGLEEALDNINVNARMEKTSSYFCY